MIRAETSKSDSNTFLSDAFGTAGALTDDPAVVARKRGRSTTAALKTVGRRSHGKRPATAKSIVHQTRHADSVHDAHPFVFSGPVA